MATITQDQLETGADAETGSATPSAPFAGLVVAIVTSNGYYLTVCNDGGVEGVNAAIRTNSTTVGDHEKFTIQPIGQTNTFSLMTSNGINYVSAVNGGGMGGWDIQHTLPIHTDSTHVSLWEKVTIEPQDDGTYALATASGYYLTAVGGGGVGSPGDLQPIHTDATAVGPWETFYLVPLPS
jgi:hypothetical protein